MAVITTKSLFDEFCSLGGYKIEKKTKGQWYKPELFEFERKIGKTFIEMNEEDALEMFRSFHAGSGATKLARSSLAMAIVWYKRIVDYYSRHYEPVYNIFHSKQLQVNAVVDYITERDGVCGSAEVESLIQGAHRILNNVEADFCECLILMHYCGFHKMKRIVQMKEENIDFLAKQANFSDGVCIRLNDRCLELIKKFHEIDYSTDGRNSFAMLHWKGSYLRFPFRQYNDAKKIINPDTIDVDDMSRKVATFITRWVTRPLDSVLTAKDIFYIGFYDDLVKRYGQERADEIIMTKGDADANNIIRQEAMLRGISTMPTLVRDNLRRFVRR